MMKQFIVLGMYRSGTSLISGVLDKLGIDIGRHGNLKHPIANPKGFFEDADSIDLNENLRRLVGNKVWYNIDKEDVLKIMDNEEANKRVKDYINMRNKKDIWGLKDLKMIPFLPLYFKYLESPYFIIIKRKKESVIRSWKIVNKEDHEDMIEPAYERHMEMLSDAEKILKDKGYPYVELDYGWYVDNREEAAKKLANFVDVPVNEEVIKFCNDYSGGEK